MKVLRTPDKQFQDLIDWPYEPHFTEVPDGDDEEREPSAVGRGGDVFCC